MRFINRGRVLVGIVISKARWSNINDFFSMIKKRLLFSLNPHHPERLNNDLLK